MGAPTLYLFHQNEPLKLSTGQTHRVRLVVPKLESDLPLRQLEGVAKTFEHAAFVIWMRRLFGQDVPKDAYERLRDDLRAGSLVMPKLELEPSVPRGHLAAYDTANQRILVSHSLIKTALNESDTDARWQLVAVLLEEFGHHVDYLLRNQYSSVQGDAPQDEGAKFAYALLNLDWGAQERTQIARLVYPFGPRSIDGEWSAYKNEIKPWVDQEQQSDLDRWRQYEFFGAGRGKDAKHNVGHSFGHQNIEDALKKAGEYYSKEAREEIYFGNWLRDVSQVISPIPLKVLSREAYTKVLDIKARQMFEDTDAFQVTPAILGVYRAEDHLDNPYGLEDGTEDDADLNKK